MQLHQVTIWSSAHRHGRFSNPSSWMTLVTIGTSVLTWYTQLKCRNAELGEAICTDIWPTCTSFYLRWVRLQIKLVVNTGLYHNSCSERCQSTTTPSLVWYIADLLVSTGWVSKWFIKDHILNIMNHWSCIEFLCNSNL